MASEDNIRDILRMRRPDNIFEQMEDEEVMRDTHGTGITQVGPRSRGRPGAGRVRTLENKGGVTPRIMRPDRGIKGRSSPSET